MFTTPCDSLATTALTSTDMSSFSSLADDDVTPLLPSAEHDDDVTPLLPSAEHDDDVTPPSTEPRLTWFVVLLCGVATIGGFLFGYDTGVVSGALVKLKAHFSLSTSQESWIVGIAVGGAAVGAGVGGITSNQLGRKPTIMLSSLFFTLGSILLFTATTYNVLILGRVVLGVGVGLASMVVPPYIAENTPAKYRGTLVTAFGATVTSGQFIASLVDGAFSEVHEGWRWMLGLATVPSVAMGLGMMLLPESARFLVQRGKLKEAEGVLQKITGQEDVSHSLSEIRETLTTETEYSSLGFLHMVREIAGNTPVKRALFMGCALQGFQQLAGINTVMYYSTTMIKMAGVEDDSVAIWLSCIPSFMNASFALVSMVIIERLPRRKLLLSTLTGTIIGLALLGGAYFAISRTTALVDPSLSSCHAYNCDSCVSSNCTFCASDRHSEGVCLSSGSQCTEPYTGYSTSSVCYSPYSWTIIAAMVFYIAMFATGIGTLAWTINSEIYPMWVRGYALSISTMTNWLFNLLIAFTFLDLTVVLTKYGAFWLYTGLTVIGWLLFYFKLPETRGVPLERVGELFL